MLAYVFWHRPRAGVELSEYERRLAAFHRRIGRTSASFRIAPLPFAPDDGYEDWYLVPTWSELGTLNAAAVTGAPSGLHDAVAALAGAGWGGVYALVRGDAVPPSNARWANKPSDQSYDGFLQSLGTKTIWQRQMVLGPAPEFCLVEEVERDEARSGSRTPIDNSSECPTARPN